MLCIKMKLATTKALYYVGNIKKNSEAMELHAYGWKFAEMCQNINFIYLTLSFSWCIMVPVFWDNFVIFENVGKKIVCKHNWIIKCIWEFICQQK